MAKGSCNEVYVLLDFLKDLGLLTEDNHKKYTARYDEIEKILYGLSESLKNK